MIRRYLAALLAVFVWGCGSSDTLQPEATNQSGPSGLAYAILSNNQLVGFSGQLSATTGSVSQPRFTLTVPVAATVNASSLTIDSAHDRLYVGTANPSNTNNQVIVYQPASQLNSASTPAAVINVAGGAFVTAYDPQRDILYIAGTDGSCARLTSASQATGGTAATLTLPFGFAPVLLNGVLCDFANDRLIVQATATNSVSSEPTFLNASQAVTVGPTLTLPGLVNGVDECFEANGRLLVLDAGAANGTFGSPTTRLLRYASANSFNNPANLTLTLANGTAVRYSLAGDTAYVGQQNGNIVAVPGFSQLTGTLGSAPSRTLATPAGVMVSDLILDDSH